MPLPEDSFYSRIPELVNLEEVEYGESDIDFYHPMTAFPKEFCQLKKLKYLSIVSCPHELPEEIGQLRSLRVFQYLLELDEKRNPFPIPASISLLDSLEELCGPFPALPWPGNFRSLKKFSSWYTPSKEQVRKLASLEEYVFGTGLTNEKGEIVSREEFITLAFLPHVKHLFLAMNTVRADFLPEIFRAIDTLKELKSLELGFQTIATANPVLHYESRALHRVNTLRIIETVPDLGNVLSGKMEKLSTLYIDHYNYSAVNDSLPHSDWDYSDLFTHISELHSLHFNENGVWPRDLELLTRHLRLLTGTNFPLDTLDVNCNYPELEFIADGYIDTLLRAYPSLQKLVLHNFIVNDPEKFDRALSSLSELNLIDVNITILNGSSFAIKNYPQPSKKRWIVFNDDQMDMYYIHYRYPAAKSLRLISGDLLWCNGSSLIVPSRNPYQLLQVDSSSIQANQILTVPVMVSSLPFPVPCILHRDGNYSDWIDFNVVEYFSTIQYDNYYSSTDVRNDHRFPIDEKTFRKGEMSYIDQYTKTAIRISWYKDGHLKSMNSDFGQDYNGTFFLQATWNEQGLFTSYLAYNVLTNPSYDNIYMEIICDTAGHPICYHDYINGHLYEFRFNTDATILSYGEYCDGKPTGTWHFFDDSGNETTGPAPVALPGKKKKNNFIPSCTQ